MSRRLPRVRRIEYLTDFLEAVRLGYTRHVAQKRLAERKKLFELEKAKALGRGRPFMRGLAKTQDLERDCLNLSIQLGLARMNDDLTLTTRGRRFLESRDEERRKTFGSSLFNVYLVVVDVLLSIESHPLKEVILPMKKNNKMFKQEAVPQGLNVSQTTFEVSRDLLTQLDLVNWFPLYMEEKRYEKVYLTSTITREIPTSGSFFQLLRTGEEYFAAPRDCSMEELRAVLWKEYMIETKYVPRRPVFYSKIRNRVCYQLRISDRVFDKHVERMERSDPKLLVVGSGGTLPYTRDSASLLKNLPLKTSDGDYIVYMKVDKRR